MEKGFLTAKERGSGKGVKEKQNSVFDDPVTVIDSANKGIGSSSTINANVEPISVTPSVPISLDNLGCVDNPNVASGPTSKWMVFPVVDNYVKNTLSKYGLVRSMLNSFKFSSKDGMDGMSSFVRAMTELRADVEMKNTIVVAMPKLVGEGFYLCTIRVEYDWKPPRCSSCKIFGHFLDECPMNLSSDVAKNLNNPRQAARGVLVGPKMGFKQLYRQIENDDDLGTNGGNSKSGGKGSLNVVHGSSSNALIIDKIDKLEHQILDGKLMLVNGDGNPLVPTSNVDSENEAEVVFDETANLMASTSFKDGSDRGYGTNSLLEQWRKTKRDDDYDPYNDDLFESHDMSDHL
ncbi:hypothetical protein Tco_0915228 [Tanacetum coccineum]